MWIRHIRRGWTATPKSPQRRYTLYIFGPDAEAGLAAYEALRQRLEKELRRELEMHPDTFAESCSAFVRDLTTGALDFR